MPVLAFFSASSRFSDLLPFTLSPSIRFRFLSLSEFVWLPVSWSLLPVLHFVTNLSCARTHVQLFGAGSESFAGKAVDKRIHEWSEMEMRMMLSWGNYKANL
jgi:hypothetical protein